VATRHPPNSRDFTQTHAARHELTAGRKTCQRQGERSHASVNPHANMRHQKARTHQNRQAPRSVLGTAGPCSSRGAFPASRMRGARKLATSRSPQVARPEWQRSREHQQLGLCGTGSRSRPHGAATSQLATSRVARVWLTYRR
jgi:hypothetical protein